MTHSREPKTQLTDEDRGRWLVTTEHSVYLFDFEGRTLQRVGGIPRPPAAPADVLQPLRHVVDVTVGRPAIWWMRNTTGGYLDPAEIWQHSSLVISIPGRIRGRAMKPRAQRTSLAFHDEGRWLVTTTSNRWIFDLDLHRVGVLDNADREWAAGGDPGLWLAGIDNLTIDEPGWWWLVRPDDGLHGQLFWIISTTVTSIIRVSQEGLSGHRLGPAYSERELLERLSVSSQQLKALIADGHVLQVQDQQDAPVFPAFQVMEDNRLLPALDAVIGELADSGVDDGRVFWSWLLSRPIYTGGRSLWELLRDGEPDTVIHAAGRAAWAWRG